MVDWKEREHKKACKVLVKAAAMLAAGESEAKRPPRPAGEAASPPAVDYFARAKAAAVAVNAAGAADSTNFDGDGREVRRCPACLEVVDVNVKDSMLVCCVRDVCAPCGRRVKSLPCPLCRAPFPKSPDDALATLRKHVEAGNPAALSHLGYCYERGELGLVPSAKKAARLYQRAADLGADGKALNSLGILYEHGNGVKLDRKKAARYYRAAADRGNCLAQVKLGSAHLVGDGVPADVAAGVALFRAAAEQGYTEAEHVMGLVSVDGRGVDRDPAAAALWFSSAASKGHEPSQRALSQLLGSSSTGNGASPAAPHVAV